MPVDTGSTSHEINTIHMGDIFIVDWNPGRGSEQTGERPALIVQNNTFNSNPNYPNTIVVAISKSGRDIPTHIKIQKDDENRLWEQFSYVKCEQLLTISKNRLLRKIGNISNEQLAEVSMSLKRVLSIR